LGGPTATSDGTAGLGNSVYTSNKLEFDASDSYKIGKTPTTMQISIANQSFQDAYLAGAGSHMLDLSYSQSLVFKTTALTATLFYNKELSTNQLLGDMLTSELTYQYKLLKVLQMSSGLSYLSNAPVAKQVGMKQSIQLMANKHFDISGSFNYMKNLVTPQYAGLFPAYMGQLSIKYFLKLN
jgi:hypothetical protein